MTELRQDIEVSRFFRVARFFALSAGLVMLSSAGLISLDVVLRGVTGGSPLRSFELSTYAFAAATAFSFGYALLEGRHIRIDAVYRLFPSSARIAFDLVNLVLMIGVSALLAYHGTISARESWQIGANSASSLQVPLVIPQGIWAAGLIWFAVCALWLAIRSARNLAARRFDSLRTEIGMGVDPVDSKGDAL